MKNYLFLTVLLVALLFVSCEPNPEPKPDPQPVDSLHHDALSVTDELFINPERGFHKAFECHSNAIAPLTEGAVKAFYNAGYSLIHIDFYMEDYRDKLIEEAYLDAVRQSMQALR